MGKTKISARRKKSFSRTSHLKEKQSIKLKADSGIKKCNPREALIDEELIGRAVWECLKEGDSEGVIEIIQIYLEAVNKTEVAEAASIARSTMYHTLKSKNPTIKTLAKLVHAFNESACEISITKIGKQRILFDNAPYMKLPRDLKMSGKS